MSVLQNARLTPRRDGTVTVALLRDPSKVRNAFGAGAHFILYKPVSAEQAQASLRAATILIKRERRRSLRVPLQVPAQLRVENGPAMEGILLDLSEDGADVLSSQPLSPFGFAQSPIQLCPMALRSRSAAKWHGRTRTDNPACASLASCKVCALRCGTGY